MTFVLNSLRDHPVAMFQMDDTTPLQDYSGYSRNATVSGGTPAQHIALVKGAAYSTVLNTTITASFDSVVFKKGFESQAFTLAAWVRANGTPSEQQVLGNPGQMDGLVINGTTVSFVTKYVSAPEARASFDLQQPHSVAIWGVHTQNKNSLYVDGELVAEIAITEEQQADQYASTAGSLMSGTTSGTQEIGVNCVAMYSYALDQDAIMRQYLEGIDLPDASEVLGTFAGDRIPVSVEVADVFLSQNWETKEHWESGQINNVALSESTLVPQFDGDTSVEGNWLDSFVLSSANSTSIYGVSLNWDGEGAIVEVSLDGTAWEAVSRGVNVSTIAPGFDPTDEVLQVRVNFPGGIVNDESYLDSLNVVGYLSPVSNVVAGRTITYSSATPENEYRPIKLHDNWGAEVAASGSLVISSDSLESLPARTIEVWVKRTGANPTFSATGAYYQDGAVATSTLPLNRWTLFHIVAGADISGSITISGPAQVGVVGIYSTALTATDISNVYKAYTGTDSYKVGDNSVIGISEQPDSATIYAYDWTIQGAG